MTAGVRSFEELVRSSERRLLRLGVMLTGGVHSAEDLVQTVFARAHRRWARISAMEHPEAYLRTMVVNEFLGWRRLLTNTEVPLAEPMDHPSGEDIGARQAQRDAAWRLLAQLPRKQRAVLVVRAGVLYGLHRAGRPDPAPPVATTAIDEDGDIWGAAIATIAQDFAPAQGWQTVQVYGQGERARSHPPGSSPEPAVTFTAVDKVRIEQAVGPLAPVQWGDRAAVSTQSCINRARVATVTVGPIVDKGDHKEVAMVILYDCDRGYLPTYRVEKLDGVWKVTGTVGAPAGVAPAAGCPKTSASRESGC